MLQTELTRFKVKVGKTAIVDEWMSFLNEHMEETLLTLENEKMFVETIFREQLNGEEFLYWYSIQGEGGTPVENFESWIDKKHLEYWDECMLAICSFFVRIKYLVSYKKSISCWKNASRTSQI